MLLLIVATSFIRTANAMEAAAPTEEPVQQSLTNLQATLTRTHELTAQLVEQLTALKNKFSEPSRGASTGKSTKAFKKSTHQTGWLTSAKKMAMIAFVTAVTAGGSYFKAYKEQQQQNNCYSGVPNAVISSDETSYCAPVSYLNPSDFSSILPEGWVNAYNKTQQDPSVTIKDLGLTDKDLTAGSQFAAAVEELQDANKIPEAPLDPGIAHGPLTYTESIARERAAYDRTEKLDRDIRQKFYPDFAVQYGLHSSIVIAPDGIRYQVKEVNIETLDKIETLVNKQPADTTLPEDITLASSSETQKSFDRAIGAIKIPFEGTLEELKNTRREIISLVPTLGVNSHSSLDNKRSIINKLIEERTPPSPSFTESVYQWWQGNAGTKAGAEHWKKQNSWGGADTAQWQQYYHPGE